MLEHLDIKNFALIDNMSVDFSEGFNVITGETGSGKSIILGALGLLMGEKADASSIRTGCDEMTVNAVLSVPEGHEINEFLKENNIETEDGTLVIRRTVKSNGKSIIRVQDAVLTRQNLSHIADSLIDMHGQSEHQSLLLSDKQRKILDSYAQNEKILENVFNSFVNMTNLEKKKIELEKQIEESRKTADYLKFALDEINNVKPVEGEDSSLKEKISVLSMREVLFENLSSCCQLLKQTKNNLHDASAYCSKAAKISSPLMQNLNRIESSCIELDDVERSLADYLSSLDYSENNIDNMQERLSALQKLKRKYGPEISDVLAFKNNCEDKLSISENSNTIMQRCIKEFNLAKEDYLKNAVLLSESRKASAKDLENKILQTLRTLGMPNAHFEIRVCSDKEKITSYGIDSIDFLISANPGEPLKEMGEIASGGELSRVMLALKTVLARADYIETQVFDEIDTGIGGSVALSLASCISDLAKQKQVIAITHLASIASAAKTQFVVSKSVENGRTYTHLKAVDGMQRVEEIARMLSGDKSQVSIEHARKMLEGNN